MVRLSENEISTYLGDVFPVRLLGEEIDKNADVLWGVDGDSVSIRTFGGEGNYSFTTGALVSTLSVGEAVVYAVYEGTRYEARVSVRAISDTELCEDVGYYFSDMHSHTSMNHKQAEFALHLNEDISDYVAFQKNDGGLDLAVISDHAGVTNDYDFFRGFELTKADGKPVIMAGAESEVMYTERDRFGILHRHSGEIVTLMSAGYADVATWEDFEEKMSASKYGFAIFAHPHVVGFSTNGIWNFDFMKRRTPLMLSLMRGIEMGNGADRKENLLHEYAYPAALDAGFRVSTTCGSDSHGGRWGFDIMPGKTVIMAKDGSKEALHEAFLKNRFYASETGNVKLYYTVNGQAAPADLDPADEYRFRVKIGSFRDDYTTAPTVCRVISDYGKVVHECPVSGDALDFTVNSTTARYFYLKLVDSEGRKTWSMPVWCGRPFDEESDVPLVPIDLSSAKVISDECGAEKLINGDPFDPWYSESGAPTVTIDLGCEREIAAFGYYPLIVLRGKDKGPDWTTSCETQHIVSRYELYASCDGDSYTLIASETAKTLGAENVIEIVPTKARYVRMKVLGNIGTDSGLKKYSDSTAAVANLSVFEKA